MVAAVTPAQEEQIRALDEREIPAYNRMRADLEANHLNEWVVMHGGKLVGAYASFEAAAEEAARRFGRNPYLIRQVGARRLRLVKRHRCRRWPQQAAASRARHGHVLVPRV